MAQNVAMEQPAMTAAALATIVRERRGEDRANQIADYAARICRSQLAAVLSNVIAVSIGAFAFVHLWSLVFDNFCAYHRLPLAIAKLPAGRLMGRDRLERWGEQLARRGADWATNVSLGFMLGMTPAIGHFVGLPLDVRHVTLNAGILSLASTSLGHRWFGEGAFLLSVSGVGVMFALNLAVSFLLALASAARAYELPAHENAELLRGLFRHFQKAPLDFFVPPRLDRRSEEATAAIV